MSRTGVCITAFALMVFSCERNEEDIDYKQEMRDLVAGISLYAKSVHEDFFVIPQNGIELVTRNGLEDGPAHVEYLNAIDGNGQEDLFYGYSKDDRATPDDENAYLIKYLNISKAAGNTILVTDYCSTHSKMDDSYEQNMQNGFVSFAADHRELDRIPAYPDRIQGQNELQISTLSAVQNFLYLINPEAFNSKADFISAVAATNYDLLIMDLFFSDGAAFTQTETAQLKVKANGGHRLVICYMSVGEAEDYRYYWQSEWSKNKPSWMDRENPDWEGNFKVRYWNEAWQNLIFGSEEAYLDRVLDAGFDGVYLDIVDAFQYFE